MDHVELTPVELPPGTPLLMANQTFPWNGDGYLAHEVLRLKEKHGLNKAIETGTCLGVTTSWLIEHFDRVGTCESHEPFLSIATMFLRSRVGFSRCTNLNAINQDSPEYLSTVLAASKEPCFIFLDAHGISGTGKEYCPLLDELEAIARANVKPCIVIHDFQVPGTDFGFDKMPDGRPFNIDLIRDHLNRIYGEDGWKHNYPTKVEGARRGWISIEPVKP